MDRRSDVTASSGTGIRQSIDRRAARKQSISRTVRRLRRKCTRTGQILTSPSKLWIRATAFLDDWATRRTIVSYTFFEVTCSFFAAGFFTAFRDVAELGFVEKLNSWFMFTLLMVIRALLGCVGFWASLSRKITLTRWYWISMAFNIPLTAWVCTPLWRCDCKCDRDVNGGLHKRQCEALDDFMVKPDSPASSSVAFADFRSPRSRHGNLTRSHAAALANVIADTVGRATTSSSSFDDATEWVSSLFGWREPLLRRSRRHRSRALPRSRRLEDDVEIKEPLEAFEVFPSQFGWRSSKKECEVPLALSSKQLHSVRKEFEEMQEGEHVALKMRHTFPWKQKLYDELIACIESVKCAVVETRLLSTKEEPDTGEDDGDADDGDDHPTPFELHICTHELPAQVTRNSLTDKQKSGQDITISFRKRLPAVLPNMEDAEDYCSAMVLSVMLSLFFLNFLSLPMYIIVSKFLMRRCGDFMHRERQFSVDFSSEDDDDDCEDDDFTTASASWQNCNPTSSSTWHMNSAASMPHQSRSSSHEGVELAETSTDKVQKERKSARVRFNSDPEEQSIPENRGSVISGVSSSSAIFTQVERTDSAVLVEAEAMSGTKSNYEWG